MNNVIKIVRNKSISNAKATYGTIYFNDEFVGYTVEPPWQGNKKGKSCIPEGAYELKVHNSAKYGNTVAFHNPSLNVYAKDAPEELKATSREYCLIHSANFSYQLQGCVAPGDRYMKDGSGSPIGVGNSKITMNKLRKLWGNRDSLVAVITSENVDVR